MPSVTAKLVHNGHGWLPEGSVVELDDAGTVTAVSDYVSPETTFYEGVLAPGFVNAHCHLELSHMKGFIPEHTGLIPFLKMIPMHRNSFGDDVKLKARHKALDELEVNGVVAVGDIANTTETLDLRALDKLHFYSFIESIGFNEDRAVQSFEYAQKLYHSFAAQEEKNKLLRQTIVPHAPYSVSSSLFKLIDMHTHDVIISIHNQESAEEDKYYTAKEGAITHLLTALGIDDSFFNPTGRSSIQSYLEWMSPNHPFIFVHNTFTRHLDVQYAHSRLNEVYWCLCPNANIYIENALPDIHMFVNESANICIGTDSLASNSRLSVLSELCCIKQHYPGIPWEVLLTWATRNGARALQMTDVVGTIGIGKQPGILQITDIDSRSPSVKRII